MIEIDHLFVCTSPGAPEADSLLAMGFTEGAPNRHPGQGTANRRIFFETTMLELVWVEEEEGIAQNANVRRLGLWERWRGRASGACPFGFCVRPADDSPWGTAVRAWTYRPAYAPIEIEVGINSEDVGEPFLCSLPVSRSDRVSAVRHPLGVRDVTALRMTHPVSVRRSPVMRAFEEMGVVSFGTGPDYLLEIVFDGAGGGYAGIAGRNCRW